MYTFKKMKCSTSDKLPAWGRLAQAVLEREEVGVCCSYFQGL